MLKYNPLKNIIGNENITFLDVSDAISSEMRWDEMFIMIHFFSFFILFYFFFFIFLFFNAGNREYIYCPGKLCYS